MLLPTLLIGQVSLNINLLDHWADDSLPATSSKVRYNECWGYTIDNQEYAIAGSTKGTHIFKITNDNRFEQVDFILGRYANPAVAHRDYKIFKNYLYAVCDEGESSLQIIDLSYLPDSVHVEIDDPSFSRVHNLYIDSSNALMYACSIVPMEGGVIQDLKSMAVYSLANPLAPLLLYTGPTDIPEVHDAYVRDNIAYLNCGFDGLRVYDFSDPTTPSYLQNISFYQDQGYNHQGWLTPDGKRYIFGDETEGKKLKNCKVNENHELSIVNSFGTNHEENSVPHNIMLSNNFAYVAYYNEGLRIYDIRPTVPIEIAHYDTYPQESSFKMFGAWGIYSKLPSGRLIVSDRINGVFLIDFPEEIFLNSSNMDVNIYPNPQKKGSTITVRLSEDDVSSFTLFVHDLYGKKVYSSSIQNQTYTTIPLNTSSGMYVLTLKYSNYLGEEVMVQRKFIVE